MDNSDILSFPSIYLSHFELYVLDVASMEEFYTRYLGSVGSTEHGL